MTDDLAVSITGVGALSTLGSDFAEISANLLAGKNGIQPAQGFDYSQHPCQIAGQVTLPGCPTGLDPAKYDAADPLDQCVLWCCTRALQDAGLWDDRSRLRIGLVLGIAAEWILFWDVDWRRGGGQICDPHVRRKATLDSARRSLELSGPTLSVAAACASGNHALAHAKEWLEMGWVDVCLAGACDVGVTPISMAAFGNLRALSRRNDTPQAALRPFDCDRDGMVLGEGGAVFALERAGRARRRGRKAYAQVAGVGVTSDAHHLVIPDPNATQAIAAMRAGLTAAEVDPSDIDYVNAHATGTPVGDICETRILQTVLGNDVERVPVSSTKSMTGHLLAAAAAVEAVACLTAMACDAIPPTVNLDRIDPSCQLHHVPKEARPHKVRIAVSNSFGFGGHNTSLVLKAAG